MGSIGDEELDQMVMDFIESDSTSWSSTISVPSKKHFLLNHDQPKSLTLRDVLLMATDLETEVREKILMYVSNTETVREPHDHKKWVVMRLQTDGYESSLCKTSWVTSFRPNVFQFTGDYEYIDVMMVEAGGKATRLIVDMDFRSQFELARATQIYQDLTSTLPSIFVGTEDKLRKIISLLCKAAKQSLKEKGLHVPPWRKDSYMQSKWLSKNCKKVAVLPDNSNSKLDIDDESSEGNSMTASTCCASFF